LYVVTLIRVATLSPPHKLWLFLPLSGVALQIWTPSFACSAEPARTTDACSSFDEGVIYSVHLFFLPEGKPTKMYVVMCAHLFENMMSNDVPGISKLVPVKTDHN
jgi:hypothetical protein